MVHLGCSALLLTLGTLFTNGVAADGTLHASAGGGAAVAGCHRPFPAFLWTGSKARGHLQSEGYQHAAVDVHDVASMMMDAASSEKTVELIVVVVSKDESFSTAGVSDANAVLKAEGGAKAGLHAKSARATFPYTYPSATPLSLAVTILAEGTGAPVQEVPLADVVSTAAESGLLTDGKMDVMIATVPATATIREADLAVRDAVVRLEAASEGSFMLLWTGDFHAEGCGRRSLAEESASRRRLQETTASYREIKMTPDILSGLLVLLLFLVILFTGLGCVADIECPQSFATVQPSKGKEY